MSARENATTGQATTVLVTGATGVLGRTVIPKLVAAGHRIRALVHSAKGNDLLRDLGAEPVAASLFEPASLQAALSGSDAVIHLATRIPPSRKLRFPGAWAQNDRIRREGTTNLVEVALAAGVETFIYPSFVWVYADSSDRWTDVTNGVLAPLRLLESTLTAEAQVARFARAGRRGVSLRLGLIYGPESPQTRELVAYARRGLAMVLGPDDAYVPSLWVQDAAAAIVAALRAPSDVYDIVDDQPLTNKETAAAMGAALKRDLRRPPTWLGWLVSGDVAIAMARSRRISNQRFKAVTSWGPSVPCAREGWAIIADRIAE